MPDHPAAPDGCPVFEHEEHRSRQQAAEDLVDLAYALTAGVTLVLRATGEQQVRVPVDVEVQLSWPT